MHDMIRLLEKTDSVKLYVTRDGEYFIEVWTLQGRYFHDFHVQSMSLEAAIGDALRRLSPDDLT